MFMKTYGYRNYLQIPDVYNDIHFPSSNHQYNTDEFQVSITFELDMKKSSIRYNTDEFQVSITTTLCKGVETSFADSLFAIAFAALSQLMVVSYHITCSKNAELFYHTYILFI